MMEKWKENELLLQAAEYFKRPEFTRLFEGIRERYAALSHLGGKIHIKELTREEAEALEGFLQMNITEGSRLTVSIAQIKKALKNTRFESCSLEEIVPLVLRGEMESNKERQAKKEQEMESFFEQISKQVQGTPAGTWFDGGILKGQPLNAQVTRDYNSNRDWLAKNLTLILKALNQLPAYTGNPMRLPVYAAAVTGNPHYFDEGKRSLTYLLYGIRDLLGEAASLENKMEARAELLYRGGILKDDLSNWVLCCGIRGIISDRELHKGMEEYVRRGEPQILTLQNLSLLKSVNSVGQKVFVVENPSVFSCLVEENRLNCACICSGGQLRLAVLILLDLLVKNNITIFYSGDFDPEGLCIAQKLVTRYGSRLKLWCYDEEIYHKAISSETISERRLKQLDGLTDDRLVAIGKLLKKYKRPGYQENVMEFFSEKQEKTGLCTADLTWLHQAL